MNRMLRGPLGRLFGRLAVQVALGTMVVVLIVGALLVAQVDAVLQRIEEERFVDTVERARSQFDAQFSTRQDQVLIGAIWTADLEQVSAAMQADDPGEALRQIGRALEAIDVSANNGIAISLYDADGALLIHSLDPASRPLSTASSEPLPAIRAALAERRAVRSVRTDPALGPAMSAAAPVVAADGTLLGVLDLAIAVDRRFVAEQHESLGVEIAFVSDGVTLVSSAPGRFDNGLWPEAPAERIGYVETATERYLAATVPVEGHDGELLGVFYLGVPESTVSAALGAVRAVVFPIAAVGALLAVLLSFLAALLTTNPLRRLVLAARHIQANELEQPVPVSGAGEVRSLSEAMEEMRVAIHGGRETLLSANRELASRVDMSTANLAEVTHQLGVIHRVLAQLDGEPPGGLPGVAEALAELEWTGGAVITLANEEGRLAVAAAARLTPVAAGDFANAINERAATQPLDGGWYVADTVEHAPLARLTVRGIGGFALQPMHTPDGVAGFVAVTSARRLALTPQREALLHSVAREVALTLERTELADEVEENRRIAESVLREMSDGVLVLDHRGVCRICNPAAARLLGQSGTDVIGQHAAMYLPLSTRTIEGLRRRTREPASGAVVVIAELRGRQLAISASLFADPDPGRAGMIVMLRDLSAEAEADRVKQDFVSMVGHELRTPLTLIRTTIDLLQEGDAGNLNDTQQRIVGVLRSNSERLISLISDLLDMSALDSGRVQIVPDSIDLGETVSAAVDAARSAAEAKQHSLAVSAPPGVPAWADRARVEQIIANLVGNAIKYTEPGGEIAVTVRDLGDMAEVAVSDNGIGIAPEEQPHLFEKFYRTSSGRRTTGGTGLGLAIARSLVDLHGGTIRCESDGRSGSTFAFTLPRQRL